MPNWLWSVSSAETGHAGSLIEDERVRPRNVVSLHFDTIEGDRTLIWGYNYQT